MKHPHPNLDTIIIDAFIEYGNNHVDIAKRLDVPVSFIVTQCLKYAIILCKDYNVSIEEAATIFGIEPLYVEAVLFCKYTKHSVRMQPMTKENRETLKHIGRLVKTLAQTLDTAIGSAA